MPDRIDRTSKAYKKELAIVAVIVTVLTLVGGAWLGHKISGAERAADRAQSSEVSQGDDAQAREAAQNRGERTVR